MTDRELLLAIQEILNAGVWSPDTLDAIESLMNGNGYPILPLGADDEEG